MTKNSRALVPCGEVTTLVSESRGDEVVGRLLYFIRETVNNALVEADKKFVLPLILEDICKGDTRLATLVTFGLTVV